MLETTVIVIVNVKTAIIAHYVSTTNDVIVSVRKYIENGLKSP